MFGSELIKNAWKIRREAAKKYNCGVMEISWKECLEIAKENQTSLEKAQDYYRTLLKKYPNRGLCFLEFMPKDEKYFMAAVFHELCRTKENTKSVREVTKDDSRYRILNVN